MEENLRQKPTSIIKITLYGPESTGKTTLSRQLAAHFNTLWIPEFARDFLQKILDKEGRVCEESDLLPIAIGQIDLENKALEKANRFLFCDTNSLVTKTFSDIYYHHCSEELEEAAKTHHYDLFFLTDIDVPWEDDGLRDSAEYRDKAFEVFKQELENYNKPYITISGSKEERLQKAIAIVSDLEKALKNGISSNEFVELYLQKKNIDMIIHQINALKKGISFIEIAQAATTKKGIIQFKKKEFEQFVDLFSNKIHQITFEKFIPASGAASRMFKFLADFNVDFNIEHESLNSYINRSGNNLLATFLVGIEKFPFYDEVQLFLLHKYENFNSFSPDRKNYLFITTILFDEKFNFLNKPKAVLPFHKYKKNIETPIEEHIKEMLLYTSSNDEANIHFTISEEHIQYFEAILEQVLPHFEAKINISFSFQSPQTDSITLDKNGLFVKDDRGNILFRPGGHGALLHNLNERNADIVFIKNIDNVGHNNIQTTSFYKKGLAGFLLQKQEQIFSYLNLLTTVPTHYDEVITFVKEDLNIALPNDFENYKEEIQIKILKSLLDRPIRVCGMVKNENEPGGGPFWVKGKNGSISLQIVESAQIDLENPNQAAIYSEATHFNPVDLVCGIKNANGEKFNLLEFTDPETGFIVEKSKNGIAYKAYELPGLWNGSMSNWITLFVEVPLSTFNPVKTVNDLLKPNHQPN